MLRRPSNIVRWLPLLLPMACMGACATAVDESDVDVKPVPKDTGTTEDTSGGVDTKPPPDEDTGTTKPDTTTPPPDTTVPPPDTTVLPDSTGDAGDVPAETTFVPFDGACGDAVSDGSSDVVDGGDSGACPSDMVSVPAACGGTSYCVDADEVTNKAYQAFLTAKGTDTTGQPVHCAWNLDYKPVGGMPTGKDKYPVVAIDWCDAFAYCAWAGKHLCGKLGGGANAMADFTDTSKDEWYNACSAGGKQAYPYGSTFKLGLCNDKTFATPAALVQVRQATGCVGGFTGLWDMSGNVYEWEDSCASYSGKDDLCRRRGGSWNNDIAGELSCSVDRTSKRNEYFSNLGIRCCK